MAEFFKSGKALCKEGDVLAESGELVAAMEKYKASARKGYALGAYNCALMVFAGVKDGRKYTEYEYTDKDRENDAYEFIEAAAKLGHAESMVCLGEYLGGSFGSKEKDLKRAFEWYCRAERAGYKDAIRYVAYCYHTGDGVEKNEKTALKYYEKGTKYNDSRCNVEYASFLQEGKFIKKDLKKAFELFQREANGDSRVAERRLGDCYEKGLGTEVDYLKAAQWYLVSAENGNEYAQKAYDELLRKIKNNETEKYETYIFLAVCYAKGIYGYEKNISRALGNMYLALKERFPEEPEIEMFNKDYNEDTQMLFKRARKKESDGRNYSSAIKTYLKAARTGHQEAAGRALRLMEETGITEDYDELYRYAQKYNDPYITNDIPCIIERVREAEAEALEYLRSTKAIYIEQKMKDAIKIVTAYLYLERLKTNATSQDAMMVIANEQYLNKGDMPLGVYDIAETNGLYLYSIGDYEQALRCGVVKAKSMISYNVNLKKEMERKQLEEENMFLSYDRERLLRRLAALEMEDFVNNMEVDEKFVNLHNIGEYVTVDEAMSVGKGDVFDYIAYKNRKNALLSAESEEQYQKVRLKYIGKTNEQLEDILRQTEKDGF